MVNKINEAFRKSSESVTTVDFFDSVLGVGFKKLYIASAMDGNSPKYYLTVDESVQSDSSDTQMTATNTVDFDIDIKTKFTMPKSVADINWFQSANGALTATTWTLKHVDSNGNETNLGSITGNTDATGTGNINHKKFCRILITQRKTFKRGETLRLEAAVSIGGTGAVHFDPAGLFSASDPVGRTCSTKSFIQIPIEVDE